MKFNSAILRVFKARAKPGKAQILKQKFSQTSVAVVRDAPGNLGHFFGTDLSSGKNQLVFISVWQDLDAIKARFGDSWEESFLPEGYDDIIEECSITHIEFDGELDQLQAD